MHALYGHADEVLSLAADYGHQYMLSGGRDDHVIVWGRDGKEISRYVLLLRFRLYERVGLACFGACIIMRVERIGLANLFLRELCLHKFGGTECVRDRCDTGYPNLLVTAPVAFYVGCAD